MDLNKGPSNQTICVIFGLLILFIVCVPLFTVFAINHRDQKRGNLAVVNGAYCREMGVPADANPFRVEYLRVSWLEGWVEGVDDRGSE